MRSIVNAPGPHLVSLDEDQRTRYRHSEELLQDLWQLSRELCLSRLLVVEDAVLAGAAGELDEDLRMEAARQAHNLVGSLGLFGLTDAAEAARTLEHLLGDHPHDQRRLEQAGRQVARLRQGLEMESPPPTAVADTAHGAGPGDPAVGSD